MFNITSNKRFPKNEPEKKENKFFFILANTASLVATLSGAAMITGIVLSSLVTPERKPEQAPPNIWTILVPGAFFTVLGAGFSSKFLQDRNNKIRQEIESRSALLNKSLQKQDDEIRKEIEKEENELKELREEQEELKTYISKQTFLLENIQSKMKLLDDIQSKVNFYSRQFPPSITEENGIESPSESAEEIKVMKDGGLGKYEKTLSDLEISHGELPLWDYESKLSKAIRKGKEIAFYIPSEEPRCSIYKEYALDFLKRTVSDLKRRDIHFTEPKYEFHQEIKGGKTYWNGEENEKGQIAIQVAPSLCADLF